MTSTSNLAECTDLPTLLAAFGLPPDTKANLGELPGCFTAELDAPDYHATTNTISHTGIVHLNRSPAHYKIYRDQDRNEGELNFGTATHTAVLEPAEFDRHYQVFNGTRRGARWESFAEEHSDKLILNATEMEAVLSIKRAVMNYDQFPLGKAIQIGSPEKSIFWIDPETGVQCRIRIDLLTHQVAFDLKTTDDARPKAALRQSMQLGYDIEAAMYSEGVYRFLGTALPFVFIFAETKAPFGIWLHTAGETLLSEGKKKFLRGLQTFKTLQETQNFHCYLNALSTMEIPKYYLDTDA